MNTDDDETVVIIDPKQPERTGPTLIHNAQGQWFIDTRLRLRGGGPKKQQQRSKSEADVKAVEAQRRLSEFERDKSATQLEIQAARAEMEDPRPALRPMPAVRSTCKSSRPSEITTKRRCNNSRS